MKLIPYKDLLKMAKETVDTTLAPVRANKIKKMAELEIAKLDERIASQEAAVLELCSKKDINFDQVIDAQDDLELTERRRAQFIKIIGELFPE